MDDYIGVLQVIISLFGFGLLGKYSWVMKKELKSYKAMLTEQGKRLNEYADMLNSYKGMLEAMEHYKKFLNPKQLMEDAKASHEIKRKRMEEEHKQVLKKAFQKIEELNKNTDIMQFHSLSVSLIANTALHYITERDKELLFIHLKSLNVDGYPFNNERFIEFKNTTIELYEKLDKPYIGAIDPLDPLSLFPKRSLPNWLEELLNKEEK